MRTSINRDRIDVSGHNYLEYGAGDIPCHFLHANGVPSGTYAPFFREMGDTFRFYASDIPGQGDTPFHETETLRDWRSFAHTLKDFIEQKKIRGCVGMGHSMGGTVTFLAAAIYPQLFRSVILIDPVILSPAEIFKRKFLIMTGREGRLPMPEGARRRRDSFKDIDEARAHFMRKRGSFSSWRDEFIEAYIQNGLAADERGKLKLKCTPETEARMYETDALYVWRFARRVKCPVLIIKGGNSFVFTRKSAEKFRDRLANAALEEVKECGHFLPMEDPEKTSSIITEFIRKL